MDGIGLRFDEVAAAYDRVRPGYPAEMFADLARLTGIGPDARVLEVGCGPGQATRDLLALGWRVHAVEPGAALAARAVANTAGLPFDVDVTTFDAWDPAGRTFDVLFSATAYHWVAPSVRWRLAAEVLAPGSPLALATNRTVEGGTFHDVYAATEDLHRRYAPEVEFGLSPSAATIRADVHAARHDIGAVWQAAEPKSGPSLARGLFGPPELRWYEWECTYDADDAVTLLSTYSPYLRVPPDRRAALFAGIREVVSTRFGGQAVRRYLAVLAVAPRLGAGSGG